MNENTLEVGDLVQFHVMVSGNVLSLIGVISSIFSQKDHKTIIQVNSSIGVYYLFPEEISISKKPASILKKSA